MNQSSITSELARKGFLGAAIGDILRAIKGKSNIGPFTLSMCAIGALSELEWFSDNQSYLDINGKSTLTFGQRSRLKPNYQVFEDWTDKWLLPLNPNQKSKATYAVRCALVHSYGSSEALQNANIDGFLLLRQMPLEHYRISTNPNERVYRLNLEHFVAELILATIAFFKEMEIIWASGLSTGMQNYIASLLVARHEEQGMLVPNLDSPDLSLDFFDSRLSETPMTMTKDEIAQKVIDFYYSD